jgi:hypothetical protein
MSRIAGSLLVVVLGLGSGCSDSEPTASDAPPASSTVQARSVPVVWADILAQRDRIQVAVSKGADMWHEECAEVSSAAAALDPLFVEFGKSVAALPGMDYRLNGVELLLGYLLATSATIRSAAVEEQVGVLPGMMNGLDALLHGTESHLKREELGPESVVTRPGFNPTLSPPPPSPV